MKKLIAMAAIVLGLASAVCAQDVFNKEEPVTWLGLDFSQLKFIKSDEAIGESELQDKYFPGWNDLFEIEYKKYDIAKATGRASAAYFTDAVTALNEKAKGPFIGTQASGFEHLDNAAVTQVVKRYNLSGKSGIGLVFIVEAMSKPKSAASVWVTFIDMGSKKILLAKPVKAKPGGFGFRNYWAGAFYQVLKDMPALMKKWSKE
ncbi:MAG: hypothetical protein QM642_08160 [Edaphocola sp.]